MDPYSLPIHLDVGDVVVDSITNESGVLVRKINLLASLPQEYDIPGINAWEILWSGKEVEHFSCRIFIYTETGLLNMIREGLFQLHKSN